MAAPRQLRPPLTKRLIDAAEVRPTRYLIFDGLVHGFAVKVEPTGRKVFMVQKSVAGRAVRVTIATYPDLTLDQARREAQATVAKLVRGVDPTAEKRDAIEAQRRSARDALSVADLWARYEAEEIADAAADADAIIEAEEAPAKKAPAKRAPAKKAAADTK